MKMARTTLFVEFWLKEGYTIDDLIKKLNCKNTEQPWASCFP